MPRHTTARPYAALALTLLLALGGAATPLAAEAAGASAPTLRTGPAAKPATATLVVKVRRPGSKNADVVVTGPGGYRRTVTRTTRLTQLPFGTYRVGAAKVTTKSWVARPTVSRRSVTLSAKKRTARAKVDYATIVSRKLRAVPSSALTSYTAPGADGSGRLVSDKRFAVGQILAAGVSSQAPDGFLVKVVSTRTQGPGTTYVVSQATLGEAVPRGSFSTTFAADVSDPAAAARSAGRGGADRAGKGLPVTCQAAGAAGIEMSASGGIDVSMGADWDFADSSISITATAHAGAKARAYLQASGSCTLAETLLYQRHFAPINVQVGPVPIVILPKLEMFAGGKVSAEGSAEISGQVDVTASLTGKASRKGFQTSFSGPDLTKSAGLTSSAKASASVYAKARVTGEVYGIAGPHATVKIGIEATADKAGNPWWSIDGTADAGLGIKVDKCLKVLWKDVCLKFDKSKENMFSKRIRLADSGGPLTNATGIANDVAGSGVSISAPSAAGDAGTGRVGGLAPGGDAWVLSTGLIGEVAGSSADVLASTDRESPGNDTLSALAGQSTYDATFVTMNVVPSGNRLRIDYLFATEEYPKYIGSQYNDVMGVFVNGQNCAFVPGTTTPVSVNSINNQVNPQYFVDNLGSQRPTVLNGLTVPLRCTVAVSPGVPVQVLIGVADASDGVLDSAVALLDGGISSYNG